MRTRLITTCGWNAVRIVAAMTCKTTKRKSNSHQTGIDAVPGFRWEPNTRNVTYRWKKGAEAKDEFVSVKDDIRIQEPHELTIAAPAKVIPHATAKLEYSILAADTKTNIHSAQDVTLTFDKNRGVYVLQLADFEKLHTDLQPKAVKYVQENGFRENAPASSNVLRLHMHGRLTLGGTTVDVSGPLEIVVKFVEKPAAPSAENGG